MSVGGQSAPVRRGGRLQPVEVVHLDGPMVLVARIGITAFLKAEGTIPRGEGSSPAASQEPVFLNLGSPKKGFRTRSTKGEKKPPTFSPGSTLFGPRRLGPSSLRKALVGMRGEEEAGAVLDDGDAATGDVEMAVDDGKPLSYARNLWML